MSELTSISQVIKYLRLTLFMEQKEFADALGLSASAISHLEHGRKKPSIPTRKKMYELSRKNKLKLALEDFLI